MIFKNHREEVKKAADSKRPFIIKETYIQKSSRAYDGFILTLLFPESS